MHEEKARKLQIFPSRYRMRDSNVGFRKLTGYAYIRGILKGALMMLIYALVTLVLFK